MGLTSQIIRSMSTDSQEAVMGYELYDLDNDPKPLNPSMIRGVRFALILFLMIVLVSVSIFFRTIFKQIACGLVVRTLDY